jgi:PAS domain S-box-containing protein
MNQQTNTNASLTASSAKLAWGKGIRGKIIFLSISFSIFLIVFAFITFLISDFIGQAFRKTVDVRAPIQKINSIILHTYEASNQQHNLVSYGDTSALRARRQIWEDKIKPLANDIKNMRATLTDTQMQTWVDSALFWLNKMEQNQQSAEELILQNNKLKNAEKDSLYNKQLLENQKLIRDKLTLEIPQTRGNIFQVLEKFRAKQLNFFNDSLQNSAYTVNASKLSVILITVGGIVMIILLNFYLYQSFQKSFNLARRLLGKIAKGETPPPTPLTEDEFSEVLDAINQVSINLKEASEFAQNIGEGNFTIHFEAESDRDLLGNSLLNMREKLKTLTEAERRRQWISDGLARFADIIRDHLHSLETLSDQILSQMIEYVGANQGGLFVANPSENGIVNIDMIASYAYHRKKYLQKRIQVNPEYAESLLGQVYLEQEKIHYTQIPSDYLQITSGLGDASPTNLLILPIKANEKVEGLLELASFKPFEAYQIEFIERICENLASAFVSVKMSQNTQRLLLELKAQTEALQTQEEEMRQNMEELASTQELMAAKQNELERLKANLEVEVDNQTKELKNALIRFDLINQASSEGLWDTVVPEDGIVKADTPFYWSQQLIKSLGYTNEEFPNKLSSWLNRLYPEDAEKVQKEFVKFLKSEEGTMSFLNEHRIQTKSGEYKWFLASAKVLRDQYGQAIRVAGFINDITAQKELDRALIELKANEENLRQKQQEMETLNQKLTSNESILRKALEKSKQTEIQIKQKNQEIAANSFLLNEIYKNVPGMIFEFEFDIVGRHGKFKSASSYVKEIMGTSAEDVVKMENPISLIHPDYQKDYLKSILQSIEKKSVFTWEGMILNPERGNVWTKMYASPSIQKDNLVIYVGIILDITETYLQTQQIKEINAQLRASEEELRQNMEELQATQDEMERKNIELEKQNEILAKREKDLLETKMTFQLVIDNLPRGVFWKDNDLRFLGCNKIFASIANLNDPQEIIGKTDYDLPWSKEDSDAYRADDRYVIDNRKPKIDIEEPQTNQEGKTSWMLTTKVPLFDDEGHCFAVLGMFEDITERKNQLAELKEKAESNQLLQQEIKALQAKLSEIEQEGKALKKLKK